MENCEKCAEMFSKKPKHAQILLKSQLSAHKCCKCKIVLQFRLPSFRALLAPRISRGHFFLAVYLRSRSRNKRKRNYLTSKLW